MGKPAHVPDDQTRAIVEAMSAYGIEQENIAEHLGITRKTLAKHYKRQLDGATTRMITKVAGALYKRAIDPKAGMAGVTAAIWLTKTRAGWRESSVVQHTGADGAALPSATHIGEVRLYLPDNRRDPVLAGPVIEGEPVKALARPRNP
jgi:hypothetical protein